jgi:hypothetical protein
MKTIVKWSSIVTGVIVLAIVLFFVGMRFHDGPIQIISGGPFKTGKVTATPDDWRFLEDRSTIEFQTMAPATSRTTWCAVVDGRLFVVSGYMTTSYGKLWKQWPHYIAKDDRVILRIDGKLYEARLRRLHEGDMVARAMAEFGRKYGFEGTPDAVTSGYSWLYEVDPR